MGDRGLGWIDDGAMTFAGWRSLRAAGLEGERAVVGDWAAVGGEGRGFFGSWLFHTSQCKALQGAPGELGSRGQGLWQGLPSVEYVCGGNGSKFLERFDQ